MEIIARRHLELADDPTKTVTVLLGRPFADPRRDDTWHCPFQIVGIGQEAVHSVEGADGFEAILQALAVIAIHLRRYQSDQPLIWAGEPDLGFPVIY
ncbi:MAG: hypothetical protein IT303_08475 [Dehalococcoidia bacterium]|nr:hypothetical protein [Dehalococcoidia bacterium]